jgi:hypothetical protein
MLGDNSHNLLQLCYAAKTWYGGFVGMMIFGASEVSRNVDLGDETTTMICKFVVHPTNRSRKRSSQISRAGWMISLTVPLNTWPQMRSRAQMSQISVGRIVLLKAAKPKVPPAKTEQEEEEERRGSRTRTLMSLETPRAPRRYPSSRRRKLSTVHSRRPCFRSGTRCARRKP